MQLCRKRSKEAGILRLPIAALAALVLVGLLAGAAGAHKASYSSKLSIKLKPSASRDSFKGTVKAGDGCEQARKVKLFYQAADGGGGGGGDQPPPPPDGGDEYPPFTAGRTGLGERLAKDKANRNGKWNVKLAGRAAPGDYTALVTKKKVRGGGHKHRCKPDESKTVRV